MDPRANCQNDYREMKEIVFLWHLVLFKILKNGENK